MVSSWYLLPKQGRKQGPMSLESVAEYCADPLNRKGLRIRSEEDSKWLSLENAATAYPDLIECGVVRAKRPKRDPLEQRSAERRRYVARVSGEELPVIEKELLSPNFGAIPDGPSQGPGGPYFDQALPCWNSGDLVQAMRLTVSALEEGLTTPFDQAYAHQRIGSACILSGNLHLAVEQFLTALSIDGIGYAVAWEASQRLWYIYHESGLHQEAGELKQFVKPLARDLNCRHAQSVEQECRALARRYLRDVPSPDSEEFLPDAIRAASQNGMPDDWKRFECPFFSMSYPPGWSLDAGNELTLVPDERKVIMDGDSVLCSPAVTVMVAELPRHTAEEPDFLTRQAAIHSEARDAGKVVNQSSFEFQGLPAIAATCSFSRAGSTWIQHVVFCLKGTVVYVIDVSSLAGNLEPDMRPIIGRIFSSVSLEG